jgi:phosphoribosyl 1,2-cyclic phosphodiesterase
VNLHRLVVLGARGSHPAPGPAFVDYGGNTSCLALRATDRMIVFDAGTGLAGLGRRLVAGPALPRRVDLFLTHFHLDHVSGLPSFAPCYRPEFELHVHLAASAMETGREALHSMFTPPLWPTGWEGIRAAVSFHELPERLDLGGVYAVSHAALRHPGGATGLRLDGPGRSAVLVTDNEHGESGPDPALIRLCRDADHVLYDAQYTPGEYEEHRGWGHSTWEEGVNLAAAAGAKRLWLYHHHPERDDAAMDALVAEARRAAPGVDAAREGTVLDLETGG